MKQNLLKTVLFSAALVAGTMGGWADDFTTYYSQDYEAADASVDWKTSASGRFTPMLQKTGGNTYLTVDQSQRLNNGCVLSNSSVTLDAGKDFTMTFDLKLGNSNNQNPVKFYVKDASKADLFTIEATATNATTWKINGDANQIVNLAGTGYNSKGTIAEGIESSSYVWYTFKITKKSEKTFLTITNTSTKKVVFERAAIKNLSENGGISGMQFDTKRYCANMAIDNILVRSIIDEDVPSATLYTITTKYQLEDGTPIAEDKTASVESGKSFVPSYEQTFDDDNYRYTYKSGAEEISSVGADATVTLVYTREALADWNIVAKVTGDISQELATFSVKDGKDASFAYPRYIAEGNKLYQIKKARYDKGFVSVVSGVKADAEISEEFNKVSNSVAFFKEAEDIPSLTSVESGAIPDRCSKGKGAYATEDAKIVSLPAGTYKIKVGVFGNKGDSFTIKAGENTVLAVPTAGYFFESDAAEFTLNTTTDLVLGKAGNAGTAPKALDYILIEKTADAVPVTDLKYASYVPTVNVAVPSDVKVYTGKVNEAKNAINLTEIPAGTVIPAGAAVLVGGDAATYTFAASAEDAAAIADNELKPATAETVGDGKTIYALTKVDGKPVFALVKEGTAVGEGHAYITISGAAGARFYSIGAGNGETTGINQVNGVAAEADGAYYTLQGMKTSKPAKGIYIHNGKKVIVNK